MKYSLFILVAFLLAPLVIFQAAEPVADRKAHSVMLGKSNAMEVEFQVGPVGKVGLMFKFAEGKSQALLGVVKADLLSRQVEKAGKKSIEKESMPDGYIEFQGIGLKYRLHSRPYLARYTEAQGVGLAKVWQTLPPASNCWVHLEVRSDSAGAELWMQGRYCGRINGEGGLVEVTLQMEPGGAVRGARSFTLEPSKFLSLDVKHIAQPGVMDKATISLKPGIQQINDVPMVVVEGGKNADVGKAKEMQGTRFLETDENTSRTALDGMPESLHFSVPQAFYKCAWVLCAVEPDLNKDPLLTTRLTRFAISGRGGAMADTSITLPRNGEKLGEGIKQVGSVTYSIADGKNITTPLYLVRVDLKSGDILDLIADTQDSYAAMKVGPYLDFEFLGRCGGLEVQRDKRRKPVPTLTSAVHVFGATLEKLPVEVRLKQSQAGNIFHNDETPEATFSLKAVEPGSYSLRSEITDIKGKILTKNEKIVALAGIGAEVDITLQLAMPDVGWYGLRVILLDQAGKNIILQHNASFALLGNDTRTAGYESPFGTWWFNGVHYTTRDPKVAGPMLFKAGMRRTTMGWTKDSEVELAPWKISLNQINWPFRLVDLNDWPAAEARAEKVIGDLLKRFPHCQYIDLFHESYDPGAYPPELYGSKYVPKDKAFEEREDQLYQLGLKGAKFIRAKFPQLKIIAGNSGGSLGIVAVMLRRGFPRELIDYLGSETTGQTIAPEKLSPHTTAGIWLMAETARKFGYDIPLTGCYEFTSRAERDLGAERHAEWYARDVMIGLANRFPTVSPAGIEDVGNSYYDTLWGASGLCQRSPLHYPKPAYVALATLTNVLDSVKLIRQMPTGSASANVLEFDRNGKRIYAFWVPRGECELEFEFPSDTTATAIEFYGRQHQRKSMGRRLKVTAGTGVSYLVCSSAAMQVTAGRRTFPENQPPAGTQVINSMDDLALWQLAPEQSITTSLRKPGVFNLHKVNDSEKGSCLELELQREGEVPNVVGEYTALRLKQPLPIIGKPHSVGVWVKGDSSWGRIFWEIEDAKGERWRSSNDIDGGDWLNQSAIDFDGWCFVTFPLTNDSPARQIEPGAGLKQWQGNGDGKLDYPLKLVGLYVQTHRQSLNLTNMETVKTRIRLKDVSAITEAK